MIHLDKYVCTPSDDLVFKGYSAAQRGTQFTCRTCHQFAFHVPGVYAEVEGRARNRFLNSLKARHAEHKEKCAQNQEGNTAAEGAAAEGAAVEPEAVAVDTEPKESDADSEEEVPPFLDAKEIKSWREGDIYPASEWLQNIPASIAIKSCCDRTSDHQIDKYICALCNDHGSVELVLAEFHLKSIKRELYEEARQLRAKRPVSRLMNAAVRSVLAEARINYARSSKGKLARVLAEMNKPNPERDTKPATLPSTTSSLPMFMPRAKRPKLTLLDFNEPIKSVFRIDGDDYSREHAIASLLPYLLHPLKRDDIEALSAHFTAVKDAPHGVPSAMLSGLARCFSNSRVKTHSTLFVKPTATQAWLATAWSLACSSGASPVRLATVTTHPLDISTNANGFLEYRSMVDLSPVGSGLLCAVLADGECSSVDPVRVLALGRIE